jgi:hypothetical protein
VIPAIELGRLKTERLLLNSDAADGVGIGLFFLGRFFWGKFFLGRKVA